MGNYSTAIDKKWQDKWAESGLYKFDPNKEVEKLYVLEMFSYPSGSQLHAGHWFNYGPVDSWARFKRMQGYNVFQPMGFDAFGLPAENFAIKTGIHPQDSTIKNIAKMEEQLKAMGAMFNWENEVVTCSPEYYKWTQWLFLKLYEKGLAYRKKAPVNWCPSCQTVLANEQVVDGACERCSTEVTKKDLTQWFFKITDYADELLDKLDGLDWPEKTVSMQKHWIGRSTGSQVNFKVKDSDLNFDVFTTRVDTLCGVSYVVLAPENPLVDEIVSAEQKEAVENYKEEAKKQSDIERQSISREKTGVFTGAYAIHPLTGKEVPIWVGDYVLATYGTGAVMAVPAHDERDFAFAEKFNLPINRVIEAKDGSETNLPFCEHGILVNSGEFDGLTTDEAKEKIVEKLASMGLGEKKVNFRLRDWLVSRQRYWGAPIPVVYCEECGIVPVPESQLPVELPYDVEFAPDGKSPLAKSEAFVNTTCPHCGKPAKRETDTLDTFVCSSWYYLRYPDNKNTEAPFNPELINKMLPVDKYVGGPEHACMHLLYARFITKALRDMGYLNFDEPFTSLTHQGLILGPDGLKMSKSKGNTISPDDYIKEYGADVFRMYLMFGFAYTEGGAWSDDGIKSVNRFVERIERIIDTAREAISKGENNKTTMDKAEKELNYWRHNTIKSVTDDTDKLQFNTAIARMMEFINALSKYTQEKEMNLDFLKDVVSDYLRLLAPFAPHFSEEQWNLLGNSYSIFNEAWPKFDPKALVKDEVEIAIQVNGKIKNKIMVSSDLDEEGIKAAALADEKIIASTEGKTVVKVIVIKGRLVNIVVK
ncbi:leucine--tRNA ligase [Clostridium perfringens]|uniref:Leucine--tRNA ligase n=1 Tax=Clostridium perfringens (strain SM101 / Type A) TaxID=289380 RepID=SYL_CLOPS|nr:leucine--tRNA ligase [Clostridium perfringens]Q0SV78.1 RecName: Full=Leucine--tRNA ligase; AltName: Full=Leucyl-tRNA synthetase; Short=LeuRS [Clostridium perfringens SM101]ABG86559.1 leucine--tRNA ligase [Clostridium perfringens SM101]EJT5918032.1 leucine--tRNA ligase [Clostridium perfringens]EJT5926291.1 leucine--tRNA ligase [Clostridium perfringens]EJT6136744.1 leucine--tRNA ligase [Clostridium perfringens]EJT6151811.1 leucine--tRNA ligase [Clostridium perfringens]